MTARKPAAQDSPEFIDGADVTVAPEDWEFETVSEEAPTRIIFDTIGDTFVGQYIGMEHIDREPAADGSDQSFDQFLYRGRDGDRYAIYESFDLKEGMEKVAPGQWCRLTYLKDVKTARNLNPMKSFRVDVRK